MKLVKTASLAAVALVAAMALLGTSSAMASSTELCTNDPANGKCTTAAKSVHFVDPLALLLAVGLFGITKDILCTTLFQSTAVLALGTPQVIHGTFDFYGPHGSPGSKCFEMEEEENCDAIEELDDGGLIEVLRTGSETGTVKGTGFRVLVECGGLHCVYDGTNLVGTASGSLLSGNVSINEQTVNKVSGFLCPNTSKLTSISTPLSALYLGI